MDSLEKRTTKAAKSRPTRVIGGPTTVGDREVWYVASDGQPQTIVTSSSSIAAMDEAMVIYAGALKRLATR